MPELDWTHIPLAESLRAFKARMTLHFEDKEVSDWAKPAVNIKIAMPRGLGQG